METFLIVQRGEDIGRRYDLDTVQLTIGRGSDNDMVLNDPMVSRYHAVVKRQGSRFTIIDLGSSNPVVINDQMLEPGMPQQINHRDVIFIGKTVFSFQSRGADSRPGQAQSARPADVRPPERPAPPPAERERHTPPPITPTMEVQFPPPGNERQEGGETVLTAPEPARNPLPGTSPLGPGNDDRTVIGGVPLGDPPASLFAPPAQSQQQTAEPATSPAVRTPPPPPFERPGIGGPGAAPFNPPPRPGGPPPDDESDESPTVFIPRDRH